MPEEVLGQSTGSGRDQPTADAIGRRFGIRQSPSRWLTLCGVSLIAAIAVGTAIMVVSFRERALSSSVREMENTVLLLSRHFDQWLQDFEVVQKDLIKQIRLAGIASPVDFKRQMSSPDMQLILKAKVSGTSDVAGVNVFDSDGELINSSEPWPLQAVNIADRAFFKTFKSAPQSPAVLITPLHSRLSGG